MHLTIRSKAPRDVSDAEIVAAARVETAIINHCIANYHAFMDADRHDLLQRVERAARERLAILQEIIA